MPQPSPEKVVPQKIAPKIVPLAQRRDKKKKQESIDYSAENNQKECQDILDKLNEP